MLQRMLYCSFDMDPRIIISYLFENWNPYVCCKYKTISERYQGVEKYFFLYRICVLITSNCTVDNHCVKLKHKHIFQLSYDYLYLFIDCALSNLFTQHVSRCWLCTVSQCTFVIMGYNLVLASSWCQIGYFKNLFLSSLILLRNGSVLDTNIWISIFKWIGNDNSKLNINRAVEQTLRHSLIPLFFGTPFIFIQNILGI